MFIEFGFECEKEATLWSYDGIFFSAKSQLSVFDFAWTLIPEQKCFL